MTAKRWWDAAVSVTLALLLALTWLWVPQATLAERVQGSVGLIGIGVIYVALARAIVDRMILTVRVVAVVALGTIMLAVATSAVPTLASAQVLLHPLTWVLVATRRQAIVGSGLIAVGAFVGLSTAGSWLPGETLSAFFTALLSFAFSVVIGTWISVIAEQSEERGRLLAELGDARAQLARLSHEQGAAAERERLSREIHDTLAQSLAGLVILTERAARQAETGDAVASAKTIRTVEDAAREALAESRALVAQWASVPDEPALGTALARLVDRFRTSTGLPIDLCYDDREVRLDRESQVVLLRCLQEGLSNVQRHARAEHVHVAVGAGGNEEIVMTIADDGVGFDTTATRNGFGLDGMRERTDLAGGSFEVDSHVTGSTVLTIRLPASEVTHDSRAAR